MPTGTVYRCVLKGTYLGEPTINRFYYQQLNGGASAAGLANRFETTLCPAIALALVGDAQFNSVEIVALGNPADFGEFVFATPITGALLGAPMPSYVAWGFRLLRQTRETNNGWKRFAGVDESTTGGNQPDATQLVILQGVANALGAQLSDASGNIWQPCIVREDPPEVASVVNFITDGEFYKLTSQNSRKI